MQMLHWREAKTNGRCLYFGNHKIGRVYTEPRYNHGANNETVHEWRWEIKAKTGLPYRSAGGASPHMGAAMAAALAQAGKCP
jgi:hypothetical protein